MVESHDRVNELIELYEVSAEGDGTLRRRAQGYFDMRAAPDSDNLRRLALIQAKQALENIEARWSGSAMRATKTEKQFIPPEYFGDMVVIVWRRPFSEPEDIVSVETESRIALEAAVEAIVAAGYMILPDPNRLARLVN